MRELNPDHFLFGNIVFAMYPADGGGDAHIDIKNNKFYDSIGTVSGGIRDFDANGEFFNFNPAGTDRADAHEIALLQPTELALTNQITILVGYKRFANQDAGFGRIVCRTNGGSGDDWSITQEAESSASQIRSRIEGGNIFSSTQTVIGEFHEVAITYNQIRHKMIIDGVVEADVARTVGLSTDQNISIGVNPGSNLRNLYGDTYRVIILDRGLDDAEVIHFQQNVNDVLEPASFAFNQLQVAVGAATPKGPLGHPLFGPFGGPI